MIFELPDLKCIASFGVKGIGPDEFTYPTIVERQKTLFFFISMRVLNEKVYKVTLKHLSPQYYLTLPKHRSFDDKQIKFTGAKIGFLFISSRKR